VGDDSFDMGSGRASISPWMISAMKRLLIVEEDSANRLFLAAALARPDTQMVTVATPLEAAAAMEGTVPSLVVLGLGRSGDLGWAFLERYACRPEWRQAPVVALSLFRDDVATARLCGVYVSLLRPVRVAILRAVVHEWLL
jgi:CheY-like chemotaxis protein